MNAIAYSHPSSAARRQGLLLATLGAIAFSGKAIIVKLAYRYGVDAVTLIMYRMLFALPMFVILTWWAGRGKPPLTWRDVRAVLGLGFRGTALPQREPGAPHSLSQSDAGAGVGGLAVSAQGIAQADYRACRELRR